VRAMEHQAEYSNIRTALRPLQVLLDERILDVPDHLLDLLPVGVYVCDRAGLIVRYNRAAAELWVAPRRSAIRRCVSAVPIGFMA
jgi:PAS domain-containing protein